MSKELMIQEEIPAYLMVPNADAAAAEFMEGLSVGAPPKIKCNGTRFVRKEADGEEIPVDSLTMIAVIVAARGPLSKSYYVGAFDPDAEASKPTCYSNDGLKPASDCELPQADACAACPMNQYGTGTNAKGEPSKGKACRDKKVLVIWVGSHPYQLDLPPTSLRNFAAYTNQLKAKGIAPYNVKTEIGFDPLESYPVLTFKFAGFVPEDQFGKVIEIRESQETKDIVTPFGATKPATAAIPAPQKEHVQEAVVETATVEVITEPDPVQELPRFDVPGFANPHREPGKASPGAGRRTKAEMDEDKAYEEANAPTQAEPAQPETGFGLDMGGQTTEPEAAPAQTPAPVQAGSASDEQLKASLGLNF